MEEELRESVTSLLEQPSLEARELPDWLVDQVYAELRRIAGAYMAREREGHTLQPTALVNEAYLKLVDQDRVDWKGKTHFLAVGAQAMRRILLDHARGKGRAKRGGEQYRVTLAESASSALGRDLGLDDLLALETAVNTLEKEDPRQVRIVEMKFFGGLKTREIAAVLGVSTRTIELEWTHARAWLRRALADSTSP